MADVRFESVSKTYPGGLQAVQGVSLHVAEGQFCVILGPSGCGKTTLLRMVAGLEGITEGSISIGSLLVNNVPPRDRDVAMVFQSYALYPHMTVYDNMAFGLTMRGLKKSAIDERVRWASGILGLEELLLRKPAALSGGQRQRVALGRAIVRQPRVFLFDEPLSNLDAKLRLETRAEIQRLHQRLKITTLYVTHDQDEALTLGERVVVLDRGNVQQIGTPLEVYHHPANRFVASFVGSPTMEFTEGILQDEGGLWFEGSGRRLSVPASSASALRAYVGKPVTLGERPEVMSLGGVTRARFEPTEPHVFAMGEYGQNLLSWAAERTQ